MILLDSTVCIEYFRKKDKSKTFFYELGADYSSFAISTVTKFEIFIGSNEK
jgi:predicted nucleic acid-binding protein